MATSMNDVAFRYYARLGRVKAYVEEHLDEDLSLSTLARIAGMDIAYFSRFFHAKTGVRFTEWVALLRVRRAIALMNTENQAITDIASQVGFTSLRTFERAFKRHTSMTPRAYKNRVRPC